MLPVPAGMTRHKPAAAQLAFQSIKGTAPPHTAQQRSNDLACCLLQVIEPLFSLKVSSVTNEGTFKNNEFVGQSGLHAQLQLDDRQVICQAPAAPGLAASAVLCTANKPDTCLLLWLRALVAG